MIETSIYPVRNKAGVCGSSVFIRSCASACLLVMCCCNCRVLNNGPHIYSLLDFNHLTTWSSERSGRFGIREVTSSSPSFTKLCPYLRFCTSISSLGCELKWIHNNKQWNSMSVAQMINQPIELLHLWNRPTRLGVERGTLLVYGQSGNIHRALFVCSVLEARLLMSLFIHFLTKTLCGRNLAHYIESLNIITIWPLNQLTL